MIKTKISQYLAIFLTVLLFSPIASAEYVDRVIIFGDSLSDNGNTWAKTKLIPGMHVIPKTPPYYDGRFSNGPVWVEAMASVMMVPIDDYAYGGAWVEPYKNSKQLFPFSLETQISIYHGESLFDTRIAKHLYVIWAGANDYMPSDPSGIRQDAETATTETVAILQKEIHWLVASYGAKHILVPNLPDLGIVPGMVAMGPENAAKIGQLAALHNKKLAAMLAKEIAEHPGVDIIPVDIVETMRDMMLHPDHYMLKNTSDACYGGSMSARALAMVNPAEVTAAKNANMNIMQNMSLRVAYLNGIAAGFGQTPCDNPNDYMYWDSVHPTRAVHSYLGMIALQVLQEHQLY